MNLFSQRLIHHIWSTSFFEMTALHINLINIYIYYMLKNCILDFAFYIFISYVLRMIFGCDAALNHFRSCYVILNFSKFHDGFLCPVLFIKLGVIFYISVCCILLHYINICNMLGYIISCCCIPHNTTV
jgi:hypothetical protein